MDLACKNFARKTTTPISSSRFHQNQANCKALIYNEHIMSLDEEDDVTPMNYKDTKKII
jgi:hypothetical protein